MRASFTALAIVGALTLGRAAPLVAAPDGLFEQETLTGDWGGVRKQLQDAGVELGANDIAETLSNPTGGIRQLTIYQGLLTVSLNLDLEKIANWPGASFYVDGYQISGRGLSRNAIGTRLNTIASPCFFTQSSNAGSNALQCGQPYQKNSVTSTFLPESVCCALFRVR